MKYSGEEYLSNKYCKMTLMYPHLDLVFTSKLEIPTVIDVLVFHGEACRVWSRLNTGEYIYGRKKTSWIFIYI